MSFEFVGVNGTRIRYEVQGEGTAVVFIHAGIVDLGMWDAQMAAFAGQYQVVRYDVRGWGQTAEPVGEFSDHADLWGLLTYLGIEQAILVGCSWGGKIAIDFALTYPEMVKALVLVGSGLGGYDFTMTGVAEKSKAIAEAYVEGDKALVAELITQIWFDGPNRTQKQVDNIKRTRVYEMALHMIELPEPEGSKRIELDPPAIERLTEIMTPTLVLVGQEDVEDIHHIAAILMDNIVKADKVMMSDTAHLPNMERPSTFNRFVLEFLEKVQ